MVAVKNYSKKHCLTLSRIVPHIATERLTGTCKYMSGDSILIKLTASFKIMS